MYTNRLHRFTVYVENRKEFLVMAKTTCCFCGKQLSTWSFDCLILQANYTGKFIYECKDCYNKYKGKKFLVQDRKVTVLEEENTEIRKKCNVCGHIFCYTQADLEENRKKLLSAGLSSLAAAGQMLGGAHTAGAVNSAAADNKAKEVIDYDRCPKCGSRDLRDLNEEEFQQEMQAASAQQTASAAPSAADELKKFKELLDMGAISQEEYDAKKKQLLGL